ncbi:MULTISPECIES: M20 family metallopeptidase [unclassified Corynebacterium]|uniref:M20 family metallopeptidase n=1 Tax=Corynebacterium TaxID=1716 RepID=UPI00254EB9DA|nr:MULTISPECIES: M20 family metallopeptidase [unclassified Corynebacterium]MDK8451791.1 M20 family metallopeptidase [Corynebacterium sp. MSK084]MDK8466301.1 M20 family metallopeptidase [Corynebacterium sp. MSK130]MDK8490726.1 M20 family metallopeptidase [Corynebacterium sp. MSK175]MDK8513727.1 M20 family metallopeptidase [Corynebacterium sp. MSK123]MDK8546897.1 M20 family metallopeptidase [Corynebacterium sp. MSK222]
MISEFINEWFDAHRAEVIAWRRHIHRNPETANQEVETTNYIANILADYGLEPQRFPHTGLMVDIGPDTELGRLAFRADIDALPITEVTGLEFTSEKPGTMHACGHDVHTTVALGLACALADFQRVNELKLGVRVIFQPAEEVWVGGATDVISWGALEGVHSIFAIHAEPKLRVGRIGIRAGAITSATDVVELKIKGPGGHTSRPHLSADVVYALGKVITELPALLSRRVDPRTGTVLVFGQVNSGYAPNAIPETGLLTGTMRTADITIWRQMQELFAELVEQILAPVGVEHELSYNRGVPPVLNDDVATAMLASAAQSIDPQAVVQAPQSSGGEDFSWYLEKVPGSMARLGCWSGEGEQHDLHMGDLIVDERAIGVGIKLFGAVVEQFMGENAQAD